VKSETEVQITNYGSLREAEHRVAAAREVYKTNIIAKCILKESWIPKMEGVSVSHLYI